MVLVLGSHPVFDLVTLVAGSKERRDDREGPQERESRT